MIVIDELPRWLDATTVIADVTRPSWAGPIGWTR